MDRSDDGQDKGRVSAFQLFSARERTLKEAMKPQMNMDEHG